MHLSNSFILNWISSAMEEYYSLEISQHTWQSKINFWIDEINGFE